MLELYHNDMSVCAQKVRFALAEKGQPWTGHHLNLRAGDQQKPDYVKLNPNMVVPTLVHDGTVIVESTVIAEYVDDAFADPPLKSRAPAERARMRIWTKQLDEGVHAATGNISQAIAFRHQYAAMMTPEQFDDYVAKIPDPVRRNRTRENVSKGVESPYFVDSLQRYRKLLSDINAALERGPWLSGKDFSLADIGFAPYITRLDHLELRGMYETRYPRIADWYERLKARKGYQEALAKWFNDAGVKLMREKGAEAWPRIQRTLEG